MKLLATGIPWYTAETYEPCRKIFDDGAEMFDTFDEWLGRAEQVEQNYRRAGQVVVRAYIDPQTFREWCAANGFSNIDAKARSHFASFVAAQGEKRD